MLSRPVGVVNPIVILSFPFSMQWRKFFLHDPVKKKKRRKQKKSWLTLRHLQTDFFHPGHDDRPLHFVINGYRCMRNQKLLCPFPHKFCGQFG